MAKTHHSPAGSALFLSLLASLCLTMTAWAEEPAKSDTQDLAKKLQNPVAAMISVPFQFNYDHGLGSGHAGSRLTLNIQPVVPFALDNGWNMVTRTITPIIWQNKLTAESGSQFGLGDIAESIFFSPIEPSKTIWGVGPILLIPSATNVAMGSGKWAVGPTAVVLEQDKSMTYGMMVNHLWSFAGDNLRPDMSLSFLEPFFTYTTKTATSFSILTESNYDWLNRQWYVPIEAGLGQMLLFGHQPVSFGLTGKYWAVKPQTSGDWSLRFTITFIFAK